MKKYNIIPIIAKTGWVKSKMRNIVIKIKSNIIFYSYYHTYYDKEHTI